MIVQAPYNSATQQGGWVRQPPIEFGWLNLTDAENPGHTGVLGHNDKAFGCGNVGGSILCRLNVRWLSQTL